MSIHAPGGLAAWPPGRLATWSLGCPELYPQGSICAALPAIDAMTHGLVTSDTLFAPPRNVSGSSREVPRRSCYQKHAIINTNIILILDYY